MTYTNISIGVTLDLLKSIDKSRGDIPRSRFINRLLQLCLENEKNIDSKDKKSVSVGNSFEANHQQILS
jgi:hypothetical protein